MSFEISDLIFRLSNYNILRFANRSGMFAAYFGAYDNYVDNLSGYKKSN